MKRLSIGLLLVGAALLPASAPAAGCRPLDCAASGAPIGHGLFVVRPQGLTGVVIVDDLRTGHTRWQLPPGVLTGATLVTQDQYNLKWLDAFTNKATGSAVVRAAHIPSLVGTSQTGSRAVLQILVKQQSTFLIVSPHSQLSLTLPTTNWGFDALAGDNLFLLQYKQNGYEVRRYNLKAHRLVAKPLKDPHESSLIWGTAWSRIGSPDGRYLFTLYVGNNGGAMVHELDLSSSTARCIDLPGTGNFNSATSYTMQLSPDGRTLWAVSPGYGRVAGIDVGSARVRVAFRFRHSALAEAPSASVSAISGDGTRIAVGVGGRLWIIAPARGSVVQSLRRAADALAFSPDRSTLWIARGAAVRSAQVA